MYPYNFSDKRYEEMNRRERRAYSRWLCKHEIWDGAEVLDRLSKEKSVNIH